MPVPGLQASEVRAAWWQTCTTSLRHLHAPSQLHLNSAKAGRRHQTMSLYPNPDTNSSENSVYAIKIYKLAIPLMPFKIRASPSFPLVQF